MARKRMISPEIWESTSFSALSDLGKIVFISLISHADDEGRGIAKPGYITNITFPYDENRRVADIKKALSEIALGMSTQFYTVNGIEYYEMKTWKRWQKIDKPSKSKYPPPPTVGVGGDILNSGVIDEDSTNVRRKLDEDSGTKKEVNRKEEQTTNSAGARTREEIENPSLRDFLKEFPNVKVDTSNVYGIDFEFLREKFLESRHYLSNAENPVSLKWVASNYHLIIRDKYKDKSKPPQSEAGIDLSAEERKANEEWFDRTFGSGG